MIIDGAERNDRFCFHIVFHIPMYVLLTAEHIFKHENESQKETVEFFLKRVFKDI